MRTIRIAFLIGLTILTNACFGQAEQPFRIVFNSTKTSVVLQSIGTRTGRNIIMAGDQDPEISLNVIARNYDEAIKFATAASGLVYRRVDATYIVATPEAMKLALSTFGVTREVTLKSADPSLVSRILDVALPFLTVRTSDRKLVLTGTRDDLDAAERIVAANDAPKVEPVIEFYAVRFVKVDDLAKAMGDMFDMVKVRSFGQTETTGMLVMSGAPEGVRAAMTMASKLDTKDGQPVVEGVKVKVYEVKYSSGPALRNFLGEMMADLEVFSGPDDFAPPNPGFRPLSGALLGGGGGTSTLSGLSTGEDTLAAPRGFELPGSRSRYLILRGSESAIQQAISLLEELDKPPVQVMVKVQVVDYSPSSSSNIGLDWSWTRFGFYETGPGTAVDTGGNPGSELEEFLTKPAGFGQFTRVPWTFQAILSAMVEKKEAKLLATPSVQVIDNEDANIFIGDTIRAQISQTNGLGGQTVQIVEFPIGIILLLRPRVNANGDITMRVHPVVSTITAINSENIPQTSAREAETTVRVKDGETVVIGGLIRDEMSKIVREVPFLSSIPILGELFRSRSTSTRKSEVLVFITPTIIKDSVHETTPEQEGKRGN